MRGLTNAYSSLFTQNFYSGGFTATGGGFVLFLQAGRQVVYLIQMTPLRALFNLAL